MEAGSGPAPSLPASHGPQSQQKPRPGEEAGAQSQKLLRSTGSKMPLYVRNQDTSEEIKSTNWGMMCTLRFFSKHTHKLLPKMGQVKAVGVGWEGGLAGEEAQGPQQPGRCPLTPPGIAGSSEGGGWDARINIHLPMHMDTAHSCPACFALLRDQLFGRSGGRRAGGDVPIQAGVGAACSADTSPAWISIPAPELPRLGLFPSSQPAALQI